MNENFDELLQKLKILKSDYHASGLKLELETEIISTSEIDLAQILAYESGMELTLKISGGSAVSDIFLAKALEIKNLLSPMIESAYALEKFYSNTVNICEDCDKTLLFNIETITALKNIDEILSYKNIDKFSTIVFGRNDFCASLGETSDKCDSEETFKYVCDVLKKLENTNLNFIIGGNITKYSKEFLKRIDNKKFTNFETRKIIFEKKILDSEFEKALDLALDFELLWLESKSFTNPLDEQRCLVLKERFSK